MNVKGFVLLAVLCSISSRFARAAVNEDFVRGCKVAADNNRDRVDVTVRCDRGAARISGLALRVHANRDIERWCSTTVAKTVEEVVIVDDTAVGLLNDDSVVTSRGLRKLSGFPHLRRLIAPRFVEQADIDAISDLQSLEDLDLSKYLVPTHESKTIGRFGSMPQLRRLDFGGLELGDASIKDILPLTGLQELRLDGGGVTDKGLEQLKNLSDLRSLRLGEIGPAGVVALKGLPHLKHLETVIVGHGKPVDLSPLTALESLRIVGIDPATRVQLPQNLRRLKFENKYAGQLDLRAARHIASVDIDLALGYSPGKGRDLRDRRARDMRWLRQLPELTDLTLEMMSHNEDGQAIAALTSLRALTIVISETPWPFSQQAILEQLDGLKQLESVNAALVISGINSLREHPNLRQLACVGLGRDSLALLLSLRRLHDLVLVLGPEDREGTVGKMLARLGELPELEKLTLANTVTNDELASLASLKKLRRLDLRHASGFDAAGIASLVRRLPDLQEVNFTIQHTAPSR